MYEIKQIMSAAYKKYYHTGSGALPKTSVRKQLVCLFIGVHCVFTQTPKFPSLGVGYDEDGGLLFYRLLCTYINVKEVH